MTITDVEFQKHVYGRTKRQTMKSIEGFDPCPEHYRGTANTNLPALLDSVHVQGLCVSLLLDPTTRHRSEESSGPASAAPCLPDSDSLLQTIEEFTKTLQVTEAEAQSIERETIAQRNSPRWFEVRRYISLVPYNNGRQPLLQTASF